MDQPRRAVWTVAQVAEYLQVNKLTIYRYIREGKLPAVRIGRTFRLLKEDVDRFLDDHRVGASRTTAAASEVAGRQAGRTPPGRPAAPRPSRTLPPGEVFVGPQREERGTPRESLVSVTPIDWVIRGLH
jgi:excisionase family DNA binding protein